MTKFSLSTLLCLVVAATLATPSPSDAQRRGGGMRPGARGGGQQMNFNASNRAGRGTARQDLRVRRDANSSVNFNRNVNRNVNRNLNVDVDVHHEYGYGYHWNDRYYHPVARAAAAITTAAVIGSYYRSLPTGCVTVISGSVTYYRCGPSWYQPTYVGSSIQYIVVNAP